MQIHQIKRIHPNKKMAQVGRGGKRGKTSGRGGKGQTARSGHKLRPEIRDLMMRTPKLRGYDFKSLETKPAIVSLALIAKHFPEGGEISAPILFEKGLVKKVKGKIPAVKILADGELTVKLNVKDCLVSAGAKEKIEKAGGVIA